MTKKKDVIFVCPCCGKKCYRVGDSNTLTHLFSFAIESLLSPEDRQKISKYIKQRILK